MKVITRGNVPKMPEKAWVGRTIKCPVCRFHGILEAEDSGLIIDCFTERRPDGYTSMSVMCPTPGCNTVINDKFRTSEHCKAVKL